MKKNFIKILLFTFMFIPMSVLAIGDISISPENITLEVGEEKLITITAYNVVGDAKIKSNDINVVTIDNDEWETGIIEEEQTIISEITIKGIGIGKTEIVLTLDAATFDSEDLSGEVRTVNVNVVEKTENNDDIINTDENVINNSEINNISNDLKEKDVSKIDVPSTGKTINYIIGICVALSGVIIFLLVVKLSKKNK